MLTTPNLIHSLSHSPKSEMLLSQSQCNSSELVVSGQFFFAEDKFEERMTSCVEPNGAESYFRSSPVGEPRWGSPDSRSSAESNSPQPESESVFPYTSHPTLATDFHRQFFTAEEPAYYNDNVFLECHPAENFDGAFLATNFEPTGLERNMYRHHRVKTNQRKRERTSHINHAFEMLRGRIPNISKDTKISKIKILQLASSYIAHLSRLRNGESPNLMKADCVDAARSGTNDAPMFNIDPLVSRLKRKRTNWSRIQEEMQRHASQEKRMKMKPDEDQL